MVSLVTHVDVVITQGYLGIAATTAAAATSAPQGIVDVVIVADAQPKRPSFLRASSAASFFFRSAPSALVRLFDSRHVLCLRVFALIRIELRPHGERDRCDRRKVPTLESAVYQKAARSCRDWPTQSLEFSIPLQHDDALHRCRCIDEDQSG